MEKQIKQCPVISSIEYDEIYYLIHKAYSSIEDNLGALSLSNPLALANPNLPAVFSSGKSSSDKEIVP